MFQWTDWTGDETPRATGLTPYSNVPLDFNETGALGDVDYNGNNADVSKTALEEQMNSGIYIVDGIVTMLFFPFRLPKLLGADSRKSKSFFFPLGHKLTCIPVMSLIMWLCAFGIGLQLNNSVYDARNLRTLDNVEFIVSIGDAIVAITMFGGVAFVVAAAVSHHPRFVRWSQEVKNVLEAVPFTILSSCQFRQHRGDDTMLEDLTPLHAITPKTACSGAGTHSADPSSAATAVSNPLPSVFMNEHGSLSASPNARPPPAQSNPSRNVGSTVQPHANPSSVVREMLETSQHSPPPEPLGGTVRLHESNMYDNPASHIRSITIPLPRGGQNEFQTLDDPIPRRYVPFTHILLDEIPPLRDENMHFVYDGAEWFEPQRQNRQKLDQSLALFRDVWTQQQREELDAQLERRRQRINAAGPSAQSARHAQGDRDEQEDIQAAHFAVINADSAEWKPSDLFKFTLGDRVRRNEELLHMEVSLDGERAVQPGETFIISNRMWHENCALYCVEGAVETHQWQAIEALFDCVDEESGAHGRKIDKAITVENMLLAMSGRDILRRFDVYNNGNVSASEGAMRLAPWVVAAYVVSCAALSLVPTFVRVLQGGGLFATRTLANFICAFGPIVLFTLCGASLMVFLSTTRRSVDNYDDAMDSFTEVTLGSASNKWYPVLNWFETTNIRTWFHLRQHILTSYEVHYNSRLAASFTVLMLASSWVWFVFVYAFTYPDRGQPTADGWLFEVSLICLPMLIELFRIFEHAASVNEVCVSHRALLAQIQVALDEELMLVGARTVNKNPALQAALLSTLSQSSQSQSTGSSAAAAAAKVQGLSNLTIANRSYDFQFLLDAKMLLDDVRFAVEHHLEPLRPFGFAANRHLVQYIGITIVVNVVGAAMVVAGFVLNSSRWKAV